MRISSFFSLAATAAIVVASACSDNPASPPSPNAPLAPTSAPAANKTVVLKTPMQANPLLRSSPLQGNVTVSKTIGMFGGIIEMPQTGATLIVPPLAVDHPVTFSVTARAGRRYAYDFEPHGTTFQVPLIFMQSFTGVSGGAAALMGSQLGYYPDAADPLSVTEVQNLTIDLNRLAGVSTIWHFSGYICMSGRGN